VIVAAPFGGVGLVFAPIGALIERSARRFSSRPRTAGR
jgi:hypothetical protein